MTRREAGVRAGGKQGVANPILTALRFVVAENSKQKRSLVVGVLTIFLVVGFVTLLDNSIQQSPIVFLKLAENTVSEADLLLLPRLRYNPPVVVPAANETIVNGTAVATNATDTVVGATLDLTTFVLNETEVRERIDSVPLVAGTAPRWNIPATLANPDDLNNTRSIVVLGIDSERERNIGYGRSWKFRTLGEDECYVSVNTLRSLNVTANAGQRVHLHLSILDYAASVGAIPGDQSEDFVRVLLEAGGVDLSQDIEIDLDAIAAAAGITTPVPLGTGTITGEQLFVALYPVVIEALTIDQEFIVVDEVETPDGKWPTSLGNVMVIESKYMTTILADSISLATANSEAYNLLAAGGLVLPDFEAALDTVNISDFALSIAVMWRDRLQGYRFTGTALDTVLIEFTNEVSTALGIDYDASFTLPVYLAMQGINFLRLFLDQLFNGVVALLLILGSLLVYSLLLSDVETKTYEYGMLRALGMRSNHVVDLLLFQAAYFSIPGVASGLVLAFLTNLPVTLLIASYAAVPPQLLLGGGSVAFGIVLGIMLPIVANVGPIRRALSSTLRDSLDVYHSTINETTVTITRLESLGLDLWQTVGAMFLVVVGFVVTHSYYMIPLAFTIGDLSLFFTILSFILLAMLAGLSLIAVTIQPLVEKYFVPLLMWGRDSRFIGVVRKNLSGHRHRNRKTAIMFTTALAFIIFAGSMFTLLAALIGDSVSQGVGSDVVLQSLDVSQEIDRATFDEYLNQEVQREGSIVVDWAYSTFALHNIPGVANTLLSGLAGWPASSVSVIGIDPNLASATYEQYFIATELAEQFTDADVDDPFKGIHQFAGAAVLSFEEPSLGPPPNVISINDNEAFDLVDAGELYAGYKDVIISEGLRLTLSVDTDTAMALTVVTGQANPDDFDLDDLNEDEDVYFDVLVKPRALLQKQSGFGFSGYGGFLAFGSPALMPMDQFFDLMDSSNVTRIGSDEGLPYEHPPLERLFIRTKAGSTRTERRVLLDDLQTFIDSPAVTITDTQSLVDSTELATTLMLVFFNVVALIAMVLAFFLLLLSFTANVRENSWEFGVMRSVGISGQELIRIYIYEALALILSSVMLGSLIGVGVSTTLTLQFNLFFEQPFVFLFPFTLFFSMFVMSIAVAVAGSYYPARSFLRASISDVLRGSAET